jgi:SAM-dependent methyltransferase
VVSAETRSAGSSLSRASTPRRWLRRALDAVGLSATAYDVRARASYALDRETQRRNRSFRAAGTRDGLPLPPPSLVYLVAGHFNVPWYYESGGTHAALLRSVLARHGYEIGSFGSLLDFGCGCGRVIRHWRGQPGVHGADANPRLVDWCRRALPFARFDLNGAAPPLAYDDEQFEFVYAISVFTHLTEPLQHAWMRELERVLLPGGVLVITTKGRSRLEPLDDAERRRFEEGALIVHDARYAGRNLCAAFHPERYIRDVLAGSLEVLDFVPASRNGPQSQDVFVLRKDGDPTEGPEPSG